MAVTVQQARLNNVARSTRRRRPLVLHLLARSIYLGEVGPLASMQQDWRRTAQRMALVYRVYMAWRTVVSRQCGGPDR